MTCYDELTLMMYADGEVDARQRAAIDAHLRTCPQCTALVDALRSESQVLLAALNDGAVSPPEAAAALAPVAARSARSQLAAVASIAIVAGGLVRVAIDWASSDRWGFGQDVFQPVTLIDLGVSVSVYLVQEREAIMSALVSTAGLLAVAVFVLLVLSMVRGRVSRGVAGMMCLVALSLLAPVTADAMDVRRGPRVSVPADQTVDDTLVAMGENVEIDGTVTGDVIAMARRVRVRGTIRGNLVAMGRDVEVDGTVEGSVLQLGQTATTRGQANGSLYAFAQTITLLRDARVGGNATTFSETASIEGTVGRDVTAFGKTLDVAGTVSQRMTAYGAQITVRSGARIERDLIAHVREREHVQVDPGATIGGATRIEVAEPEPNRYLTATFYVGQIIRLVAAFVTGWLLFWLIPRAARASLADTGRVLTAAGVGALLICATPIIAIVIGVTIIGLPLALFAVLAWAALLYLAKILVALSIGRVVLARDSRPGSIAMALLVGLLLVIVAINLPWVGFIVNMVLTIVGFGLACVEIARWYRGGPEVPAAA